MFRLQSGYQKPCQLRGVRERFGVSPSVFVHVANDVQNSTP